MKVLHAILLLITLLFLSFQAKAQKEEIKEMHEYAAHLFSNISEEYLNEVAKLIIEDSLNKHSFEDYLIIGTAALFSQDEARAEWGRMAALGMEPTIRDLMKDIRNGDAAQKKNSIKQLTDYYETVVLVYSIFKSDDCRLDFNQIVLFFHQFVYGQKDKLYDKTKDEELLTLLRIIACERFYCAAIGKYDILFNYLSEFYEITKVLPSYHSLLVYYELKSFIFSVFSNKVNYNKDLRSLRSSDGSGNINPWDYLSSQNDPYSEDRLNYYLRLRELELKASMGDFKLSGKKLLYNDSSPIDLTKFDWHKIKQSLKNNECALLLNGGFFSSITGKPVIEGTLVTANDNRPIELFSNDAESLLKNIFNEYPHCNKVFLTLCENYESIDFAYCDNRVYLKYSLMDIGSNKEESYKGGEVFVIADIDFGNDMDRTSVQNIQNDKMLVSELNQLFGNKMYSLTGNKVNKINFLNTINRFSIFHISTHGIERPRIISPKNIKDLLSVFSGASNMERYSLVLSNYNENKENSVSAEEIRKMDFSGIDLVFLDACNTGNTTSTINGSHSISKSFYLGGASNVISYLQEVNQSIALEFALLFYQELFTGNEKQYHDAFYKTKRAIINKFKDSLLKDDNGRPIFDIVLYE